MANVTKVPSSPAVDGEAVEQRAIRVQGNQIYLTEWVQIEDDQTLQVVAGPQSFSVHCGLNEPDRENILRRLVKKEIQTWEGNTLRALEEKALMPTFEADLEAELAIKK